MEQQKEKNSNLINDELWNQFYQAVLQLNPEKYLVTIANDGFDIVNKCDFTARITSDRAIKVKEKYHSLEYKIIPLEGNDLIDLINFIEYHTRLSLPKFSMLKSINVKQLNKSDATEN